MVGEGRFKTVDEKLGRIPRSLRHHAEKQCVVGMHIDPAALLALEPISERLEALLVHVVGDVGLGVERISSTIERIIKAGIVKLKDTPPVGE